VLSFPKKDLEKFQKHVSSRLNILDGYYRNNIKSNYETWMKYYNSDTSLARRPGYGKEDSRIFIPRTRENVDAIVPKYLSDIFNLSGEDFYLRVIDKFSRKKMKRHVLELHLSQRFDAMNFDIQGVDALKWMCIYGVAIGMVAPNPRIRRGNPTKNLSVFKPINPCDYRVDPADSYDEAYDEVLPFSISVYALENMSKNAKFGKFFITENLKKLIENAKNAKLMTQKVREWWGYWDVGGKEKMVQAWLAPAILREYDSQNQYTGEQEDTYNVIMCVVDPYKNNKSPLVLTSFEKQPGQILGVGIPYLISPLQDELNELRNLWIDLLNKWINSMKIVNEDAFKNPDEIRSYRRNGVARIKNMPGIYDPNNVFTSVSPTNLGIVPSLISGTRQLDLDIQSASAQSSASRGMPDIFATPPTASEFQGKLAQANIKFAFNVRRFYKEFIKETAVLILEHDRYANLDILSVPSDIDRANYTNQIKEGLGNTLDIETVDVDPANIYLMMLFNQLNMIVPLMKQAEPQLKEQGKVIDYEVLLDTLLKGTRLLTNTPIIKNVSNTNGEVQSFIEKLINKEREKDVGIINNLGQEEGESSTPIDSEEFSGMEDTSGGIE